VIILNYTASMGINMPELWGYSGVVLLFVHIKRPLLRVLTASPPHTGKHPVSLNLAAG
jgi:hypothetical protein